MHCGCSHGCCIYMQHPDKGYCRIRDDLEHDFGINVNDKRILRICRAKKIKSTIKSVQPFPQSVGFPYRAYLACRKAMHSRRNETHESKHIQTPPGHPILHCILNAVVLADLPYLSKLSHFSISLSFFNRWFSISDMRSWCFNWAISICACSSSVRGSCSYLRLPRRSSRLTSPSSLYFSVHVRAC